MKKQLRERLRVESNAEMAESIIYTTEPSFIHELQDLLGKQQQPNDHILLTSRRTFNTIKSGLPSPPTNHQPKVYKTKNQVTKEAVDTLIGRHRSRNKIEFNRISQQIQSFHPNRTNMKVNNLDIEQREKRRAHREPSFFQIKKQPDGNALRSKFDYNRSAIPKIKDFIYNSIVQKCLNCGSPKSEVFRGNLVCKNRKCRLLHYYQDFSTFPLSAILYDIETPSSTCEQLEELMKKIKEEVKRIEQWRDSLMQLHFQVQSIFESRRQVQKQNKNDLKNFISSIGELKLKKPKENQSQIQSIRSKLEKIQFRQAYDEFNRWRKVDPQKFLNAKTIYDLIHKCKPLCLKTVSSDLAETMADVSDNFNNLRIILNASQLIPYNFTGNLNKIVLIIDGSVQVKRDNFLCVENLQELKLIFNCRKTSRQLRELFNILPHPNSLIVNFDYKLNSHLSTETFPLITQAFSSAKNSIEINLQNARLQFFEDLAEASKIVQAKQKIRLLVHLNPFISEGQWPEYVKSSQWGTKIIKNIIKNMGNKAINIELEMPVTVNLEQISEFIINSDYYLLSQVKINCRPEEGTKKDLKTLLDKMINKRKLLLGHLLSQKRQSSHPLNISRRVAESVYQALF